MSALHEKLPPNCIHTHPSHRSHTVDSYCIPYTYAARHCDSLSLLASLGADFRFCNSACQLEVASVVEPDILGELSVNPEGHAGGQTAGTDGNDVPRREDLEEDLAFLRTILRTDRVVPFCDAQANGGVISGQDALGLGLVTKVTENPHMDALTLAHMIAAGSPDAVSAAKQLYV